MANIKEVAKAAGVSVSTVSRTINNSSLISTETKDRVFKEIKRLNYSPNLMAKGLSMSNSYTVTLLVDVDDEKSFQNPFFYEVMHGIEKHVYQNEFLLIVANLNTTMKNKSVLDWLVNAKRTEGVILPASILNSKMVNDFEKEGIPFVSIGEPIDLIESINWVDVDNKKGGESATYILMEKGYKTIAFVGLNQDKVFSSRRFEGYGKALAKSHIPFNPELVVACDNTKEDGYLATKRLLERETRPDAIICADNLLSFGVLKAIREADLKIPEQIGIISFDNRQIAELSYPTISTVNVDVFELGYQSAKLLFEQINNLHTRSQGLLISTSIEERETTLKTEPVLK